MSQYLNINQNVKGKPNENYAREFMELFCLGPTAPDGTPNYSQTDVAELARRSRAGRYNNTSTNAAYGTTTFTAEPVRRCARRSLFGPDDGRTVLGAAHGDRGQPDRPRPTREVDASPGRRLRARARQPRAVPDPQAVGRVHRQPDPAGDARRAGQRLPGERLQAQAADPQRSSPTR